MATSAAPVGQDAWAALLGELYGLAPRGIRPGLERMRAALKRIGDPQGRFDVAHVAGTNGKGSVAAMIAAGVVSPKVARFTSPHLHSLTERFVIDGRPVSREVVIHTWERIRSRLAEVPLTFFETVTALAFAIFEAEGVELAVLETGLGGRLDSTNVSGRKLVTAITRVAVDHASWLGDDLVGIAREKAGIMAPGVPCVVGSQSLEVDAELGRVAAGVGAEVRRPVSNGPASGFRVLDGERTSAPLSLALPGAHQRENAAVAVGALWALEARGLSVDPVRATRVRWPGRLERLVDGPELLLDVAHNPNAARALARYLATERRPTALVFGAMRDKDWCGMLGPLRPLFSHVVLTRAPLGRAEEPAAMASPGDHVEPRVSAAVERARELVGSDGLVVVAGSVFIVAEVRALRLGIDADPPIAL